MSDMNAPERIWIVDGRSDAPSLMPSGQWWGAEVFQGGSRPMWGPYIPEAALTAAQATPAPREDGYSAGVRAAAEVASAVYHTCVEDAAELTAIKIRGRILALLDAPALPDARAGAVEPVADGFTYITRRIEHQVRRQPVGQYGEDMGAAEVLSRHPTREAAVADRPNHGKEHEHVKGRWVPHGSRGYEEISIVYTEVPVPTPACTATDGPASACVYRAPGLGTAADWDRG